VVTVVVSGNTAAVEFVADTGVPIGEDPSVTYQIPIAAFLEFNEAGLIVRDTSYFDVPNGSGVD
jgi:hypothetical protein